MDSLLAGLLAFFTLIALVGGHSHAGAGAGGALAEQYWKYVLPNVPMPASLSHLLDTPSAAAEDIGPLNSAICDNRKYLKAVTDMQLLNGHRDYGRAATATEMQLLNGHRDYGKAATAAEMRLLNFHRGYEKAATAADMQLLNGHRDYEKAATPTEMHLLKGHRDYEKAAAATEMQFLNGHRDYGKATPAREMQLLNGHRDYEKAATATEMQLLNGHRDYGKAENQLHKHPGIAAFFLEEDIQPGKKLTFHFVPMRDGEKFLPSIEANAIPFSSNKIPEILSRFSVNPESAEAAEMTATVHECEKPASKGEKKVCARSLESMVDFATSSLGTSHVNAVSTIVGKDGSPKQDYVVTAIKRKSASLSGSAQQQLVVCHAEPYPYAVFLCHLTQAVRAYTVSMVGKDGVAVQAAAVCHVDTTGWNPMHISFQILKVKPGTVPVCHFLLQSDVVWTRSG